MAVWQGLGRSCYIVVRMIPRIGGVANVTKVLRKGDGRAI